MWSCEAVKRTIFRITGVAFLVRSVCSGLVWTTPRRLLCGKGDLWTTTMLWRLSSRRPGRAFGACRALAGAERVVTLRREPARRRRARAARSRLSPREEDRAGRDSDGSAAGAVTEAMRVRVISRSYRSLKDRLTTLACAFSLAGENAHPRVQVAAEPGKTRVPVRWRWDLNPRRGCPLTRFRGVRARPLRDSTAGELT
jgi:hypothetical protein